MINELRRNNYVSINGNPIRVLGILDNGIVINNGARPIDISSFNPIQLTEEILLKCKGSEEKYKGMFGSFVSIDLHDLNFSFGKENIMRVKKNQCGIILSFKEMKLHEFQNLVFSLTRKELEVSL